MVSQSIEIGQQLDAATIQDFRAQIRGQVILPGDPGYDEARQVWNGIIDRRPGLIVRPGGNADVITAVNFARERQLLLSIRGGGHNAAGTAVNDGGMVIDLSLLKGVWVDPQARTVRVGGGATWGEVDRETQVFGLATPGGNVSTTGVAGLTLHGGMGYLRRKYGLSIDNLLSVEIVTADGQLRRASQSENPDLFWAVRGAGSNFGVVTSFEFRLHPVGPQVLLYGQIFPFEEAGRILPAWRDFVISAPDEFSSIAILWTIPPVPMFPKEAHFLPVVILTGLYSGPEEEGRKVIQPLTQISTPVEDLTGVMPYTAVQSMIDAALPKGTLAYWKSLYVDRLDDEDLKTFIHLAQSRPSPFSQVGIWHHGGAVSHVAVSETAFPYRKSPFLLSLDSIWTNPQDSEKNVAWTRQAWTTLRQTFSSQGPYLNFPGFGEEQDFVQTAYGPNYPRLLELKNRYDPTNLFRMNMNIKPETSE